MTSRKETRRCRESWFVVCLNIAESRGALRACWKLVVDEEGIKILKAIDASRNRRDEYVHK